MTDAIVAFTGPHDSAVYDGSICGPVPNNEIIPSPNMPTPGEDNALTTPEPPPSKRRKKKSIVWEYFTIESVGAGCRRACCKQCKQTFAYSTGSKVAGTSHLKRHIAKGTCTLILRNQLKNQLASYTPSPLKINGGDQQKRRYRTSPNLFDQDRVRHEIANMMIMHEYPLHMVEHPGFLTFVRNLQPRFVMTSFDIVQGDCVATYLREKNSLLKFIEGVPGRVSLSLDLWTSKQTTGYIFVTGHFIDGEWKSHRRILNVLMEPFPDSESALSHALFICFSDWGFENKLFSLTIDQSMYKSDAENLRSLLCIKNPNVLSGQILVRRCIARTLSSIAKDVLTVGQETVKKIRDSVKHVKMSTAHEEMFLQLKQRLQVPSRKILSLDDQSKWNTTYEMLAAASELKEVFSCLDIPDYKEAPTMEEWKRVETLCAYLKPLFDTASIANATSCPTANAFFHEVWKIKLELVRAASGEDAFANSILKLMEEKFDRYWEDCNLILAVAVAMDPRFKLKLVEFSFSRIYGEAAAAHIKAADEGIHELFDEYVALPLPLTPAYSEEGNGAVVPKQEGRAILSNGLSDFDVYIMETSSQQARSELDQYLEESLLPRVQEFDVLGWWKLNRLKYPTLSKMARDILTIPVCTVSSDSVFDVEIREMDAYRSSLRPEVVEALVCAKDWLRYGPTELSNALVKMELPV